MGLVVDGALAEALKANRSHFNDQFHLARLIRPELDAAAFSGTLAETVQPIVDAVAVANAPALPTVVDALYTAALELVGRRLLGAGAIEPHLDAAWQTVLPKVPGLLAADPVQTISMVSNGVLTVARTPGARPADWIAGLAGIGDALPEVATLATAGKVLAWTCGLAQFRAAALAACRNLPEAIALAILGIAELPSGQSLEGVLGRLESDPWLDPARTAIHHRVVVDRHVSGFRGLGGVFVKIPTVECVGAHILVTDGDHRWWLQADHFGSVLVRATSDAPQPSANGADHPFSIDATGHVHHATVAGSVHIPHCTSVAITPSMLVAVSTLSYSLHVVIAAQS